MGISIEELKRVEGLGLKKHIQIVDGYIATGLDLDDITIHYAVGQEHILLVLHGYGFGAGFLYGDETEEKKKYKGLPFHMVEEYVSAYFPGFLNGTGVTQISLNTYLEQHYPEWRNSHSKTKPTMFRLSPDELQGKSYFDTLSRKKRSGFFSRLQSMFKKT